MSLKSVDQLDTFVFDLIYGCACVSAQFISGVWGISLLIMSMVTLEVCITMCPILKSPIFSGPVHEQNCLFVLSLLL